MVVNTLAEYAPDLPGKIEAREVITPKDLEQTYGLTGGHIFHGELALDQLFTMRPLLDWAQYRTPVQGLYLCGSGTHPGNGLNGGSGANAAARAKDLRRVLEVIRDHTRALECSCPLDSQPALQIPRQQPVKQMLAGLAPHRQPSRAVRPRMQSALHRLADPDVLVVHPLADGDALPIALRAASLTSSK